MHTIVFTICSINYLAQAKILGNSLLKHNPDYKFFIGLVDDVQKSGIDPAMMPEYPLVEIAELSIDGFDDMFDKYNITELNTSVKPFFFNYFYQKYPEATSVIYLDPDIEVFQPFTALNEALSTYSIVLTPHILSPLNDDLQPRERDILNVGVYNLGFLGTSRSAETLEFISWWEQKLRHECYIKLAEGMFVDQLWVDYAPIFWKNVLIFKNIGYNMAYWNLHERHLTRKDDEFYINGTQALVFFHYSGFDPHKADQVSKYQNRHTFISRPDLKGIFDSYSQKLLSGGQDMYKKYKCFYMKPEPVWQMPKRGQRPRQYIKNALRKLIVYVDDIF